MPWRMELACHWWEELYMGCCCMQRSNWLSVPKLKFSHGFLRIIVPNFIKFLTFKWLLAMSNNHNFFPLWLARVDGLLNHNDIVNNLSISYESFLIGRDKSMEEGFDFVGYVVWQDFVGYITKGDWSKHWEHQGVGFLQSDLEWCTYCSIHNKSKLIMGQHMRKKVG